MSSTSGWPTQPSHRPPPASRPWWKKKRYSIPLGTLAALTAIGLVVPSSDPDHVTVALAESSPSASAPLVVTTSKAESTAAADEAAALAEAKAAAKKKATAKAAAKAKAKARAAAKAKAEARAKAAALAKRKAAAKKKANSEPARRIVTPGAFCADAELGDIGYSSAGRMYTCSYYPSNDRNRWKRS